MNCKSKEYFESRAEVYRELEWVSNSQFLETIALHIPLAHGVCRAIDIGVGTAATFPLLHQKGYTIVGVDISNKMLSKAREYVSAKHPEFGQHISFLECDATTLPFENGYFHLAFARNSLHHFRNPSSAIQEAHRVLTIGGKFILIESVAPTQSSKRTWMESLRMKDTGRNMDFTFSYSEMYEYLTATEFVVSGSQLYRQRFSVSNWLTGGNATQELRRAVIELFMSADATFKREMGFDSSSGDISLDRYWGIYSLEKRG